MVDVGVCVSSHLKEELAWVVDKWLTKSSIQNLVLNIAQKFNRSMIIVRNMINVLCEIEGYQLIIVIQFAVYIDCLTPVSVMLSP